jgi:hypothetical protein
MQPVQFVASCSASMVDAFAPADAPGYVSRLTGLHNEELARLSISTKEPLVVGKKYLITLSDVPESKDVVANGTIIP